MPGDRGDPLPVPPLRPGPGAGRPVLSVGAGHGGDLLPLDAVGAVVVQDGRSALEELLLTSGAAVDLDDDDADSRTLVFTLSVTRIFLPHASLNWCCCFTLPSGNVPVVCC